MENLDLRNLPRFNAFNMPDEYEHPNYAERAEVCYDSKNFLGRKRALRRPLYVKGISFNVKRPDIDHLEAFSNINYDDRGKSSVEGVVSIPIRLINEYIPLVEK